ncbi:MAG: DUF1836 domain-containing protein [Solirubrobacterales bacterium]
MEEELREILEKVTEFDQLTYEKIPDIDLYMDQVTTFIEEKLGYLKRSDEEDVLTKTMINNYTKAGILIPPNKKKYSRDNMVLIVLTYYLKQVLSINDIEALLSPMVKIMKNGKDYSHELEELYNTFIEIEKKEHIEFKEKYDVGYSFFQGTDLEGRKYYEMLSTVLELIIKSAMQKRMAEKIIDEFFSKKAF